ncbi:hypothetical protein L873DRAFT_1696640, partial [Choiromyces venosus 120613-1]
VYRIKKNPDGTLERFYTRAITKGFSQIFSYNYKETFILIIYYKSFHFLPAIYTNNK